MNLDFQNAKKSFVESDVKGMKKVADDFNKILTTALWNQETEGLEDFLAKTEDFIEELERDCEEIRLDNSYFYGFIWGIENMARNLFFRNREYENVDKYLKKSKELRKILYYIDREEIVDEEELIEYLNISEEELRQLIFDVENLNLFYIDGIGRDRWYALSGFAEKYIQVRKDEFIDISILDDVLEGVIDTYEVSSITDIVDQNLLLKKEAKEELVHSLSNLKREHIQFMQAIKSIVTEPEEDNHLLYNEENDVFNRLEPVA